MVVGLVVFRGLLATASAALLQQAVVLHKPAANFFNYFAAR
jgi:hypothetical protein